MIALKCKEKTDTIDVSCETGLLLRFHQAVTHDGNVADAVVGKEGDGGEGSSLLASVLTGGTGEYCAEFSDQGASRPQTTCLVKESGDLSGCSAVPGREAKNVAVEPLEVVGLDDWVVCDRSLVAV